MGRRRFNIIKVFKALASEKRVKIYLFLQRYDYGLHLSFISDKMKIPLQTLGRHILKLRNAGLVESKRHKNKMVYSVRKIRNNFDKDLLTFVKRYLS